MKYFLILLTLIYVNIFGFAQAKNPLHNHNNLRKLSKIQDKKDGRYITDLEDPKRRSEQYFQMTCDPNTGAIPKNIRDKLGIKSTLASHFVASLELVKEGNISLKQDNFNDKIFISFRNK